MTDFDKKTNPITEAWMKYPEWRADFIKNVIIGSYKSLFEEIEKQVILEDWK